MQVTAQAKDYSASGEQAIILDVLGKMGAIKDGGTFLDLGAGDGYRNSNTRALSDQGWKGVLVESDPREYLRLVNNHKANEKMACVLGRVTGIVATEQHKPSSEQRVGLLPVEGLHGWGIRVTPWELAQVFGGRYEFISVSDGPAGALLPDLIDALGPCLTHTRLVCYRDVDGLAAAWTKAGFTELVGHTRSNVLVCRKEWAPGYAKPGDAVKAASIEALKEHGAPTRIWFNEEQAPEKPEPTMPPDVIADPKKRMEFARGAMKMSAAEAGRLGGLARARKESKL